MFAITLPEFIVKAFLRYLVRPVLGPPFPIPAQRCWLAFTALLSQPPLGIRRRRISLGGVDTVSFAPSGVPATGSPHAPVVLYLHGGAFVAGSSATHAGLTGFLARELHSVVHVVLYGLAPERPYPAGRDDAMKAYSGLLDLGIEPGRIVLAGDSAGGAMVADLLLDIARAGAEPPAGGVMLSPAVGLAMRRADGAGTHDTLVRRAWAEESIAAYRRPGTDPADRILGTEPALLAMLPPVYLQFSDEELLAGECRTFVDELRAAGASPQVHADRGSFHVLALLPGVMKRAMVSLGQIAAFSRTVVTAAAARDGAPRLDVASGE